MKPHLLFLCCIFTYNCSATTQTNYPSASQTLSLMQQREIKPQSLKRWATPDSRLWGRVESTTSIEAISKPDYDYIRWNIGTSTPPECYLYKALKNPAQTTLDTARKILLEIDKKPGSKTIPPTLQIEAGHFHGRPYLELAIQNSTTNALKLFTVVLPNRLLSCTHNELGYRASFDRIISGLVKNIHLPDMSPPPTRREINRIEIDTLSSGYEYIIYKKQPNNQILETRVVSVLSMQNPSVIIPIDRITQEITDPTGFLVSYQYSGATAQRKLALKLQTSDGTRYTGAGEKNQKQLTIDFSVPAKQLLGTREANTRLHQYFALSGSNAAARFLLYDGSLNPLGPTELSSRFTKKESDGSYLSIDAFGSLRFLTTRNAQGEILKRVRSAGPSTIRSQRVYLQGTAGPNQSAPEATETTGNSTIGPN